MRASMLFTTVALIQLAACSAPPAGSETASPEPASVPPETSRVLPSEEAGYYTRTQSERGRAVFEAVCGECHYLSDFRGRDFEWSWRRQTARNLYEEMVETMPEDDPGALTDQQYIDILAYILSLNDYPAGEVELRPTDEAMDGVPLGPDVRPGGLDR